MNYPLPKSPVAIAAGCLCAQTDIGCPVHWIYIKVGRLSVHASYQSIENLDLNDVRPFYTFRGVRQR